MSDMIMVPLSNLIESTIPLRPVKYNSIEYAELVASIRVNGILQPLLVRRRGDRFEVVEGGHRRAAAIEAGLKEVPCLVRDITDDEVMYIQVEANAIRPVTTKVEFANRLMELVESRGLTIKQLSATVRKGPTWVREMLSIAKLPRSIQSKVTSGELSVKSAVHLSRLPYNLQLEMMKEPDLNSEDFIEKIRVKLKHIRECVKEGGTDLEIMRQCEPYPWYRSLAEIKREALDNTCCADTLQAMGAVTAQDGWRACLAWMLHLDPRSVNTLNAKWETRKHEDFLAVRSRKDQRAIANSLMKIKDFKNE